MLYRREMAWMARLSKFVLVSVVVCLLSATLAMAQSWEDLKSQFLVRNPNGEWTCGFLNEDSEFVPFNTTVDDGAGVTGWCMNSSPGVFGDVTVNFGESPIDGFAGKGRELIDRKGPDPDASCLLTAAVKAGDTVDFVIAKKDDVTSSLIGFDAVVEVTSREGIALSSASPVPISPQKMSKLLPGEPAGEEVASLDKEAGR